MPLVRVGHVVDAVGRSGGVIPLPPAWEASLLDPELLPELALDPLEPEEPEPLLPVLDPDVLPELPDVLPCPELLVDPLEPPFDAELELPDVPPELLEPPEPASSPCAKMFGVVVDEPHEEMPATAPSRPSDRTSRRSLEVGGFKVGLSLAVGARHSGCAPLVSHLQGVFAAVPSKARPAAARSMVCGAA